jgi:cyclic beta-1,2-glucan synthetase
MWAILAFAEQGHGDKAADLFALLNPINHARTPGEVHRYKVEPYVVAADVYSVAPHVGRGGWTWYTGSAAWMYRAGVEGILGLRREGEFLIVHPCLPMRWPGFRATVTFGAACFDICVEGRAAFAALDGAPVECRAGQVSVRLEPGRRQLWIGATPYRAEA